jgi:hypothetical protein
LSRSACEVGRAIGPVPAIRSRFWCAPAQRAGVHTHPRGAVGVPQLRVEDVAASAGAMRTARVINLAPAGVAAPHPHQLHGRWSGYFDGMPDGAIHGELVERCCGQSHAQRCAAVPRHALDLRGGSCLLVVRQSAARGGVAAVLLFPLAGHDRLGHPSCGSRGCLCGGVHPAPLVIERAFE